MKYGSFILWNKLTDILANPIIFLKNLFVLRVGKRRRGGRETSMCKRYMDRFPLTHAQLGTWPATQAGALTGNRTGNCSQAGVQSTEPHLYS